MSINVTLPFLPPIEEYSVYLKDIWRRNWLTNNGPLVNQLELKLKDFLGLNHLLFTCNGTVALQIAIKALGLKGEIITTPFSYVATTSSIVWEGCQPVMVDINSDSLTIDPSQIERAVTRQTSAILATHVYGNACDVGAIGEIAARHGLKVIYDGAHGFGVKLHGKSIFAYGDISTASFHATKLFHTIEGGAVFCSCPELLKKMALHRNFGHVSPTEFGDVGINGKNSEFHAAMGLCNISRVHTLIAARGKLVARYESNLARQPIKRPAIADGCEHNHAYFPVILDSEPTLKRVVYELNRHGIYPRRYFYPSLDELAYVGRGSPVPVSRDISRRILCLPLYHSLSIEEVDMICRIVARTLTYPEAHGLSR